MGRAALRITKQLTERGTGEDLRKNISAVEAPHGGFDMSDELEIASDRVIAHKLSRRSLNLVNLDQTNPEFKAKARAPYKGSRQYQCSS